MDLHITKLHTLVGNPSATQLQIQEAIAGVSDLDVVVPGERLTVVGKAVEAGNALAVRALLEAGAGFEVPQSVQLSDDDVDASSFLEPLGQAVQLFMYEMSSDPQSEKTQQRFDVVVQLMGAGADPTAIDPTAAHSPLSELMTQLAEYAGCGPSLEDLEPAMRVLAHMVQQGVSLDTPADAAGIEQTPAQCLAQMQDVGALWQSYLRQVQLQDVLPEPSVSSGRMRM